MFLARRKSKAAGASSARLSNDCRTQIAHEESPGSLLTVLFDLVPLGGGHNELWLHNDM